MTSSPVLSDTWPPAFLVSTIADAVAPGDILFPLGTGPFEDLIRVLLVDDEEDEFIATRDLLRRAGGARFSLEWASTFEAGLALLDADAVSICLVDYRLGEQSGLDFVRAAQARSLDVPMVLMTGRGDRAVDSEAIDAGAADYLDKSELTPALLERSIRYAIERAATLRRLRQSEELHRSIVASVAEGLLVLSRDGRVLTANPAAGRILQIIPAALVGRSAFDEEWSWFEEGGAPLIGRNHPLRPIRDRPLRSRILGIHRHDGTIRWLEVNSGSMREVGGDAAFVISFLDVTDIREASQRLAQADRVDALDRLAGGIAHDFNNLVTVMRGCVDLLVDESVQVPPDRDILATLRTTADRATDLARQLLGLRGQSRGDTRVIDLVTLVHSQAGIVRQLVGDQIELTITGSEGPALVRVDPTRVEHAILNLAANARDAMPEGGRLGIHLGVERLATRDGGAGNDLGDGDYVSLTVHDTGHGMDEADLARVFEPYFTTKGRGRGTGLGLASVYGTIRDSGGDVRIESAPGAGATIWILLPRITERRALGGPSGTTAS
jgi:PAS domain S-box-containing protein